MREYNKPAIEVVELTFSGSIAIISPRTSITGSGLGSGSSDINLFVEPQGADSSGTEKLLFEEQETE